MRADEYTGLSALQIAAAVNSRELSAVEVAEVALAVAEQVFKHEAGDRSGLPLPHPRLQFPQKLPAQSIGIQSENIDSGIGGQKWFFHIMLSTGLSVFWLYFAFGFLL